MAFYIENLDFNKQKYDNVFLFDLTNKSNSEKDVIIREEIFKTMSIPIEPNTENEKENEIDPHTEESQYYLRDSKLKPLMVDGTSAINVYFTGNNLGVKRNYNYNNLYIFNSDRNVDIKLINPNEVKPINPNDIIKLEIEDGKLKFSGYRISAFDCYYK